MSIIKITIEVSEGQDPEALGEAIANLIKAVTPKEEWAEVAQILREQVETEIRRRSNVQEVEIQLNPDSSASLP